MAKNNKKGPKANVFKVAGAKSLKKTKAKAVNLGLKDATLQTTALRRIATRYRRRLGQPIKYQRKPGSRRYIDYTQEQLEECLAAIKAKEFTQRDAADFFNIPRSTIKNKLAKKNCNKPGRQPIFSEEEEDLFAKRIATLSEFGFPLSNFDIKMVIKDYLTSQNKTVTIFKNNLPGKDWLKYFFDRHTVLCENLESKFGKVNQLSETLISEFIDHVTVETENVPPQNIYTYYEISLRDDPSKKKIVCRRGIKYPESTTVESAKAKFSVMFCGNAVGESIPPYVVYKSEPGCSSWTQNGPKGAHYNCTRNGWMNSVTFENWFLLHVLPVLKKRRGRKVLIGDNLSSHINGRVLTLCEKYNIHFVCLPYKANHILQPLHYAYFQPLRVMWPQLLLDWQSSQIAKQLSTTLKEDFPYLLKKALNTLADHISQNIVLGFEKSGIFPIDKDEPLYRLPISQQRVIDNHMLKYADYELLAPKEEPPYSFQEDDSVCYDIIPKEEIVSNLSDSEDMVANLDFLHENFGTLDENLSTLDENLGTFDENLGTLDVVDGDIYILVVQDNEVLKIPVQVDADTNVDNPLNVSVDDYVIVTQGTSNYPGKVLNTSEEGAYIHCMKRWKSLWRWPAILKEQLYSWEEIVCKIDTPKLVKRGCFFIPEIDCN